MRIMFVYCLVVAVSSLPMRIQDDTDLLSPPEIPIMIEYGIEDGNNVTVRNQIRPGMQITSYAVELEPDIGSGTYRGRVVTQVIITDANTREDEIVFHVRDLNINSVRFSIAGGASLNDADFNVDEDDGLLEIETGVEVSLYTFYIEYTGSLNNVGSGSFMGEFDGTLVLSSLQLAGYRINVFQVAIFNRQWVAVLATDWCNGVMEHLVLYPCVPFDGQVTQH